LSGLGFSRNPKQRDASAPKAKPPRGGSRGGQQIGSRAATGTHSYQNGRGGASERADFPVLWISCGRDEIGRVYESGDTFEAVMATGRELGAFASLKAAKLAILAARRAAP
jgi:hypothetical protein